MSKAPSSAVDSPLAGIKVLDASRVLAGPYTSMLLGDLGAEVIKVERPGIGDQTRGWGPPYVEGESTYYLSANRNKQSMTLNLKTPQGRKVLDRLASQSDVFIQNFRPVDLSKLGMDFAHLSALNPKLIYCSITGYGKTSSWKDRPAYDLAAQAESGLMSITGQEGGEPVRVGVAVLDIITAHNAVHGILAALIARGRTGSGQEIDISILDCSVAFLSYAAQHYLCTGTLPKPMGSGHPSLVPYQAFATSDSWIVIAAGSPEIWSRLCQALDHPELETDPRFFDNSHRVENRLELESILTRILQKQTTQDWLLLLQAHRVPVTPVNDLRAALELPPVQERGMVQETEHPKIGPLPLVNSPIKLGKTPTRISKHPPMLGEHTDAILRELGYQEEEIASLREMGVV